MSTHGSQPERDDTQGERLMALEHRLRLLVLYLAGRAILARTEADDLLQEVYVRAVTQPASLPERDFDDPGDQALYRVLAKITRHVVIDVARSIRALKREGKTRALVRADWSRVQGVRESQVPGLGPGPATQMADAEVRTRLAASYRTLAPDHRRVIGLRQFEGKTASETAARMGRSETAIHSLYRRALEVWDETTRGD